MGNSDTGFKFSFTAEIFKTFFVQSLKKYVKNTFSNFASYSKGCRFSITKFDILIFCNILHFEINFGNFFKNK